MRAIPERLLNVLNDYRQLTSVVMPPEDEVKFYDALSNNESATRLMNDETLKKIAHELTESLRQNMVAEILLIGVKSIDLSDDFWATSPQENIISCIT